MIVDNNIPYEPVKIDQPEWLAIEPELVNLDNLTISQDQLSTKELLDALLGHSYYDDNCPHAIKYNGKLYLITGINRVMISYIRGFKEMYIRIREL